MKVEFKIVAESQEEVNAISRLLMGEIGNDQKPVAEAKKTKKTKEPKSEPAVEPVNEEPANEEPVNEEPVSESTETSSVDLDTVRALAKELIQSQKGAQVSQTVKSFGFASLKDVPDDKLDDVHAALSKISKGE